MFRPAVKVQIMSRWRNAPWDKAIITLSRVPELGEFVPVPGGSEFKVSRVTHCFWNGDDPDAQLVLDN